MELSPILKKAKGSIFWLLVAVIIGGIIFAIALPTSCGYPKRAKISQMLVVTAQLKTDIGNAILANSPISNINLSSLSGSKYISYSKVTSAGEIILFSEELGAFALLTPNLSGGSVTWSCFVSPQKFAPAPCRN